MKNSSYLLILAFSLLAYGCSKESDSLSVNDKEVLLLESGILQFKDQITFDKYLNEQTDIQGFYSFQDYYVSAMNEAESFYDRPGGYEEFKAKYAALYFPEQENDYSGFLPVSDVRKSKYLNIDGKVMIGNETKNFIDINSFQQLKDLRLVFPEVREDFNEFPEVGSKSIPELRHDCNWASAQYTFNDKYRVWVEVGYRDGDFGVRPVAPDKITYARADVIFRKKGILGIWFNYSETTSCSASTSVDLFWEQSKSGYSSHDYYIPMGWVPGFGPTGGVNVWGTVTYRGNIIDIYIRINQFP